MVRKPQVEYKYDLRGGKGEIEFNHILSQDEMMGHGTMFAKLILKPGSVLGRHQHVGNKEPYYIVSGTWIYTDNDGTVTTVGPGDVCYIDVGDFHGIENPSKTENLELIALILNEA